MVWEGEGGEDTRGLKEGMGESRWKRVARFRLVNKMREGRYWEEEEMQAMWKGDGNMGARVGRIQGLEGEGRGLTGNSG